MGRSGLERFIVAAVRASAKAARDSKREEERRFAANQRYFKSLEKLQRLQEKEAKQKYIDKRAYKAIELTKDSNDLFTYLLCGILPETLKQNHSINFETLKPKYEFPHFKLPKNLESVPQKPKEDKYILDVGKQPFWGKLFPSIKEKWLIKVENAKKTFQQDLKDWQYETENNEANIIKYTKDYEERKVQYEIEYSKQCIDVDEAKALYFALNPNEVVSYVSMVLEHSEYFIEWERNFRIAYSPDSKEILVEFQLPNFDIIPMIGEYKYVKSNDFIIEKQRKSTEIDICYKALISSISLRTIYEVIKSDQANAVTSICFNGYIIARDLSNGNNVKPTIISVSTSKSKFETICLDKIDPISCIRGLSAIVSSNPRELIAVKPIREFAMVDKRFVIEEDVVSTLDSRPNLMDLNPFEFENLVSNLFSRMGLDTKQTRSSKDGGVDAIAFDSRPILGGKIVIQAKRYKNTVGVSAARDLYGTMINEGASKGILVTTSSYGPDTFEFSKDKPIELIDGGGLLYLLNQVGVKAKIVLPE
ncbi:restriction system protein [Bacteroides luti]|uniref:Restriction system protein n=1 Tax=Bacteroides luti TaxID=1297750 RepID=A0A1M4VE39_9BACE|nr:restriction endonuclease [Bacteroides luti]SHE67246.1 restriction system protein [Bacteroides luti]